MVQKSVGLTSGRCFAFEINTKQVQYGSISGHETTLGFLFAKKRSNFSYSDFIAILAEFTAKMKRKFE